MPYLVHMVVLIPYFYLSLKWLIGEGSFESKVLFIGYFKQVEVCLHLTRGHRCILFLLLKYSSRTRSTIFVLYDPCTKYFCGYDLMN